MKGCIVPNELGICDIQDVTYCVHCIYKMSRLPVLQLGTRLAPTHLSVMTYTNVVVLIEVIVSTEHDRTHSARCVMSFA